MSTEEAAELRRAMILAQSACQSLIDRLDADNLEQLGLISRLDEVCDLIATDLRRYSDQK